MAEIKEQFIHFLMDADLADKPLTIGEALTWPLHKVEIQNLQIESIKEVRMELFTPPYRASLHVAVGIWLNTTGKTTDEKSDYSSIKHELATKISEYIKHWRQVANKETAHATAE
jgi:hypothetical protein